LNWLLFKRANQHFKKSKAETTRGWKRTHRVGKKPIRKPGGFLWNNDRGAVTGLDGVG